MSEIASKLSSYTIFFVSVYLFSILFTQEFSTKLHFYIFKLTVIDTLEMINEYRGNFYVGT